MGDRWGVGGRYVEDKRIVMCGLVFAEKQHDCI